MKEAIIKAIEDGGYSPSDETNYDIDVDILGNVTLRYFSAEYPEEGSDEYSASEIALDKNFWQALGKAMGWEGKPCTCKVDTTDGRCIYNGDEWRHQWHRFIDHLAEGKDTDSFFKELLS